MTVWYSSLSHAITYEYSVIFWYEVLRPKGVASIFGCSIRNCQNFTPWKLSTIRNYNFLKRRLHLIESQIMHCLKSVRIPSYSGLHFPAFGLNTERYSVSLRIQSECGKIWTRITPNTDTFYAVMLLLQSHMNPTPDKKNALLAKSFNENVLIAKFW